MKFPEGLQIRKCQEQDKILGYIHQICTVPTENIALSETLPYSQTSGKFIFISVIDQPIFPQACTCVQLHLLYRTQKFRK